LLIWFVVVFSEENNRAKVKKEKNHKNWWKMNEDSERMVNYLLLISNCGEKKLMWGVSTAMKRMKRVLFVVNLWVVMNLLIDFSGKI
jgi:hypothetical protein